MQHTCSLTLACFNSLCKFCQLQTVAQELHIYIIYYIYNIESGETWALCRPDYCYNAHHPSLVKQRVKTLTRKILSSQIWCRQPSPARLQHENARASSHICWVNTDVSRKSCSWSSCQSGSPGVLICGSSFVHRQIILELMVVLSCRLTMSCHCSCVSMQDLY